MYTDLNQKVAVITGALRVSGMPLPIALVKKKWLL